MINELIGPLCGLAGVMVGAAVSSLGALATSRRGWNSEQVSAKRLFQEEVVAAAHSQLILLTLVRDRLLNQVQQLRSRVAAGHQLGPEDTAYLHDENHVRRVEAATHEWRAVFAKRIIYAEERLSAAMEELDSHRANLTAALNAGNIAVSR